LQLAPGANALESAELVRAEVARLSANLPQGWKVAYLNDATDFIKLSISEVVKTLIEAIVLVVIVMFVFLQSWRATLIPAIAVPVVLLGTFGIIYAAGFSINTLTLFGLVLAIGLLVDDAIVVVENVERLMHENPSMTPRQATIASMREINVALIAIALVLSAVFLPMVMFGGSTGVIYRQFSLTIVSAMFLSVLVAIVLTPALCATMLKPIEKGHHASDKGFFGWFNNKFDSGNKKYQGVVHGIVTRAGRFMIVFAAMAALMGVMFFRLPSSFLPQEDQGFLFTIVQTPVGATQERTGETLKKVEEQFLNDPAVDSLFTVQGFSFAGNGQNAGMAFSQLKPWEERASTWGDRWRWLTSFGKTPMPDNSVNGVVGRAMGNFMQIKDAFVFALAPPAVFELGNSNGFV
ncbi:efflux RND transporter permease subunit, partial [Streptosporangium sp. NPDC051023]|uniref:efflux RND transporter permease subunit n=1 Tax=Streptosporangium sp. NPDC051023 TaxID=3155410 RepID=UPI00344F33B6